VLLLLLLLLLLVLTVNAGWLLQHTAKPFTHALLQAIVKRLAVMAVNHDKCHITAAGCWHCAAGHDVNTC
jgi:hypothetical protein